MAIIHLICKSCGGNIELDDTQEFGFCRFCKEKMLIKSDTIINDIKQSITKHVYGYNGKDADELISDGQKLLSLGEEEKANTKFKQALNITPNSWEAWFGYASTGGDKSGKLSFISAYRNAYNIATDESQEIATLTDMMKYLPDHNLSVALLKTYKTAVTKKRNEMFNLIAGVIGCDESEIATLVVDLCPNDWRAWLERAKIRQLRVRHLELEGLFKSKLPQHAVEVLDIFLQAYKLAKNEGEQAKNTILSYISTMEIDSSYKVFVHELNTRIKREG